MDSPSPFAALPLDEQLQQLEAALQRREDPRALLTTCATVRDHAPLAWLARRLLEQEWLASPSEQRFFAEFLLERPETAVDRVLRALVGDGSFAPRQGEQLRSTLIAVLDRVTVDRVSVMCLIDRALKHNFADARDDHVRALTERCAAALAEGRLDEVGIDQLAQVSAPGIATLRERAAAHGPATAQALEERLATLARRTLEVLGQAPKAVSQANAEELLSKRVYTDPGHFLVELLQNAEDAGARCFRLRFSPRRIVVWHDGQPFDTRDVVGVTSIGQTTKRKQQIGFFGVGFKSVYEVTDRPRIYSDVYRFEIADVSIPKALSSRPADLPAEGTVLVLPLRNPDDPERSPAALFAKARDLDAIVLFTLRRIDVIDLELEDASGRVTRHAVHELPPDERGISRIRQEPEGWVRGYAVHDAEHVYLGGGRAPGRADRTRVMVGLRVDEDGVPRPLEPDTPTVYSYLPTEEHSGLRMFVQGHFDVPVDRERITQDSRWNEWILSKVPPGLAALAEQLTAGLPPEHRARVAEGLLCVLPLQAELGSPIFRRIVAGLRPAFGGLAVVPCEGGSLRCPSEVVEASEDLAALFEGEPVHTHEGVRHLVAHGLEPRAIEVARALGARPLRVGDLVDELERCLAERPDGSPVDDPAAPIFVRQPTPARLAAAYEVLDDAVMRRAGAGPRRLVDLGTMRRLRGLPLVLSDQHRLHRPGPGIVRAEPALREIYAGLRAFVHPEHDASVDPEDPTRTTATAFIERLGVPCLSVSDLVEDLHARLGSHEGPVAELASTSFPGTPQRLRAVLALLADAPAPVQRRAARLPLFLARDGRFHRAAKGPGDRRGVLLYEPGGLAQQLLAYYDDTRPVCAPAEDDPALALLRNARTPTLSLASLIADLRERVGSIDDQELERLHTLLEAIRDEVPDRARRELAALPIWPDTRGIRRPLRGPEAVRLPGSPAIAELLPAVPFLHPAVLARRHAHEMGGEEIGLDALVGALEPGAEAPLRIEPSAVSVSAVLEVLRAHKDAIHPRLRARLAEVPAFLDDAGRPCRLDALSLAEDEALRSIYADWPQRRFVDPSSLTRLAIAELELDARLTRIDTTTLAADLAGISAQLDGQPLGAEPLPLIRDHEHLRRLLELCAERAASLPRAVVQRLCRASIFPDLHERLGPLGAPRRSPSDSDVHACEPALRSVFAALGVRVLVPWAQQAGAALLETAGHGSLDVVAMVESLEALAPVVAGQRPPPAQTRSTLRAIHEVLLAEAPMLSHRYPPQPREHGPPSSRVLGALPIWPTITGGVVAADVVIDSEPLHALLASGSTAKARLDAVTPDEEAVRALRALAPLVHASSAPAFAAAIVRAAALPGEPLARQPLWLRDPLQIAALCAFIGPEHEPRPLVDATGRLHLHALRRAQPDTVALVEGTALAESLLHPALAGALPHTIELPTLGPAAVVDALVAEQLEPMPVSRHPRLHDEARRRRLYAWLVSHESAVFTDADARARLRSLPLWPTDRGTIRPADQLVVDPDLPRLDVDWTPHPEIPLETLSLLVRHLGIGRPPVEDLVVDHLAPAYRAAAQRGDGPGAARLLEYLARALSTVPADEARGLLSSEGPVLVEGAHERFVPASTLLLAPPELAAAAEAVLGTTHPPPHPRLPPGTFLLLAAVGVPSQPPRPWIADVMRGGVASTAAACGLALIVAHLHRDDPRATVEQLPLRDTAWVLDGNGIARRPGELFAWTADVQALVGDAPGLYPAPEVARALGELGEALGFRSARDVRLPEIVAHVDGSREAGIPLPFRVYQWMERGLSEGWLDGAELRRRLQGRAWVCSDDGEYHPHERVLGVRALEHFGSRRGYWERGRQHCPTLCQLFGIADAVTPAVLMAFLEEIAGEAERRGDQLLLSAEPGLPRMLLRAYAALGVHDEATPARLVLCRECGGDQPGALRLRPPEDPLVLRSDAPALEAMFAAAGRFYAAAPGPLEDRPAIDAYYQHCGIVRLRDAYEIRVDTAGQDLGPAYADGIASLRTTLRGLLATLPRVRLQRTHLRSDSWVYEQRLAPLARTGPIRVRAGLRVDYVLPGVGRARAHATAVYDPRSSSLLVDQQVLADPIAAVTGLAQGLMACIYDGTGEEQLVDIVEILLRLATRERMDAYLDQRFFPTAAEPEVDTGGRLAARVGELFDYGLDRRLVGRFPELRGRPLDRWREPSLFAALPQEQEPAVRSVVARMLAAIERSEARQPLVEALALLLSAASLSDVPAGLLAPESQRHEPELGDELGPRRPASTTAPPRPESATDDGDEADRPSLSELEDRLLELVGRDGHGEPFSGDSSHRIHLPSSLDLGPPGPPSDEGAPEERPSWLGEEPEPEAPPPRESGGFWSRLARRLGLSDELVDAEDPPWARPGANVLEPMPFIGPQLWVRGSRLREMATHRVPMGLLHQPAELPAPYRYVVHTLGVDFEVGSQRWHPRALPSLGGLYQGERSGAMVAFAGTLAPGRSVVPIPLFGDIVRMEVVDADPSLVRPLGRSPGGSAIVEVHGERSVRIRYDVALRRPPVLTEGRAASWPALPPTVPRDRLPRPVREWLERNASAERGAWEQARRVEAFVQRHYLYDLEFRERPEVERAARELRPGEGNHHLELLHASGDAQTLGRGVCYELNTLVVELLRHLGIPAMVANGWMLDEGFADRPDHLFALAVVPSAAGTCLIPLEASTGPRGPVRPLAGAAPPDVSLAPHARPTIADPGGGWSGAVLPGPEREVAVDEHVHTLHRLLRAELDRELAALRRVIRIAEAARGQDVSLSLGDDVTSLRQRAIQLLGDPARLPPMLAVIRGDYDHAPEIPEVVQALARDGLATVQAVPSYRVRPADERGS
ncbi:MAG: transglutaminase domain-containing protein [Myxococcales bacterium]|nr:transglutaminase domain-containing protein [Myxococcales bacterium]